MERTSFEQFHSILQCPRNLLSERLTKLVEEGILERSEYREPGSRARNEYRMTDMGRELTPILLALMQWGARPSSRGTPGAARICTSRSCVPAATRRPDRMTSSSSTGPALSRQFPLEA